MLAVTSASPIWTPDPDRLAHVDLFRSFVAERTGADLADTDALQSWSLAEPDAFWSAVWDYFGVVGERGERSYVEATLPGAVFFPEATLSLAENYLRRIPARDDAGLPIVMQTAEVGDGVAITASLTRDELEAKVAATAAALRVRGVKPGDRIAIVLPVGMDALIVSLAGFAIGAVMSSASPDFGVPAIVDRFGQLDPVLLVATTSYRWNGKRFDRGEHLVELVRALPSVRSVLIVPGSDDVTSPVDLDVVDVTRIAALCVAGTARALQVDTLPEAQRGQAGAEPAYTRLPVDHPSFVLFSSGTTGKPKCLIHRAGGVLLKHLTECVLHADVGPGDRLCFYTTTGWMMWNWATSILATGGTLVLHDGAPNYPAVDAMFRLASVAQLTHLGVGARLLDSMRTQGCDLGTVGDLSHLRMVLVTGSPLTEGTARWLVDQLGPRVMPNAISGGTDLVGCFFGGFVTKPVYAGEIQSVGIGLDVDVYDEDGQPTTDETPGELVCRNTFPTVPLGIWGDDDGARLRTTYFERFPGVWTHGDLTSKTAHGGYVIHGRSDATLNVAGVRIGTGEIYTALEHLPEVVDALAFAQAWDGDTRMVLLVVLAPDVALDDALRDRIKRTLRERCSPRHVPEVLAVVPDLPRTLTNKLAEIAVADTVNGRPVRNRDALANPGSLDVIAALPELQPTAL